MSPKENYNEHRHLRFPRVSGDEPVLTPAMNVPMTFSPRERG